jgi:hypothetical protein
VVGDASPQPLQLEARAGLAVIRSRFGSRFRFGFGGSDVGGQVADEDATFGPAAPDRSKIDPKLAGQVADRRRRLERNT